MSQPRQGRPPPHIHDPFPENGRINQGFPPQGRSNVRPLPRQAQHRVVRNKAQLACCQRGQVVIHHLEMQALEVWDFTRNMQGKNLPLSIGGVLGSAHESVDEETTMSGAIAVVHDDLTRGDRSAVDRQFMDGFQVVGIQAVRNAKLGN
jgi:hypothetical protein